MSPLPSAGTDSATGSCWTHSGGRTGWLPAETAGLWRKRRKTPASGRTKKEVKPQLGQKLQGVVRRSLPRWTHVFVGPVWREHGLLAVVEAGVVGVLALYPSLHELLPVSTKHSVSPAGRRRRGGGGGVLTVTRLAETSQAVFP